jgi:transcriptional regulator GlxA family with amidase domain
MQSGDWVCHAARGRLQRIGANVTSTTEERPLETPAISRPSIALLAARETSPSVLYGLYDVLLSVGAVYPDMTVGQAGDALLDVRIVAATGDPFRCFGDVLVEPHAALADIDDIDVAIVCDMYTPIDVAPRGRYPIETDWLRRMHAKGSLIASACTGSLVLAEAGLLDGRRCASHWAYRDLFRDAYPTVTFSEDSILDLSSEADGVITGGGVTAWQDLALHLIARLCGREHALQTAKVYLLGSHSDGQTPFAAMTRRPQQRDAIIGGCQAWIAEHYASPNPVASMAQRSGLQPRTFSRRFRAATGYLPIDYVHDVRVDEARSILETEACPVDDVGYRVGYEDPTFFRRLFKRKTGLTPAAYRRKFATVVGGATFP